MHKISTVALMSLGLAAAFSASAQTTVTAWTFNNLPVAANNSPAPSTGTGTATPLGMTNSYTYSNGTTGSVAAADVLAGSGGNLTLEWRVRGSTPNNGWNLSAPQYTQGAQFSASTVGFGGITFNYGWISTNQGVRNLQAQYTTDGSTWANAGALQVATTAAYQNLSIDFNGLGLTGVDNNANFGVRLVSAFDPTFVGSTSYTSATLTGGLPVAYNNNSGNWRFDNISITAAVPETGSLVMLALGLPLLALALRRKQG
jgi:hypothetical protein